jgi:cytidyltransferase-like protein
MPKKVFVSGCFDILHSGHIRFLEEASQYGDLYVGIGSDRTVKELKGHYPVYTEKERHYMLGALKHVKECCVNSGSGLMDFLKELKSIGPDIFVVNEDGNTPAKLQLCQRMGIKYIVLSRDPSAGLPRRSTTSLLDECRIPYRLDLAGGWLDQPMVSKHAAGPVVTISVEPTLKFTERSGMASSTRRRAIELWRTHIPNDDPEKLAKMLFSFENPPGTKTFSGSQDAIGIVFPGLNRLDYDGNYWPRKIASVNDEGTLRWLEKHLYLAPLGPRGSQYDALKGQRITSTKAGLLASAADSCWKAIQERKLADLGYYLRKSFEAQVTMFPAMSNNYVRASIRKFADLALGWKLSGSGGGGYLVLVSDRNISGSMKIKIFRNTY